MRLLVTALSFSILASPVLAEDVVFSMAFIPDTQHTDPTGVAMTGYMATAKSWIKARKHDCHLGNPRDDAAANGCIDFILVQTLGDTVEHVGAPTTPTYYASWQTWLRDFWDTDDNGDGDRIRFGFTIGNHDLNRYATPADGPPWPGPTEYCGKKQGGSDLDIYGDGQWCGTTEWIAAGFTPSLYTYPGFAGCSGALGPATGHVSQTNGQPEDNLSENLNCYALVPTGHGFDVLVAWTSYWGHYNGVTDWLNSIFAPYPTLPKVIVSHQHLGIGDGDGRCGRAVGEYWSQVENTEPKMIFHINGHTNDHYRAPIGGLGDSYPWAECTFQEDNAAGYAVAARLSNWQMYHQTTPPSSDADISKQFQLQVVTFNFTQDTIGVKTWSPATGLFTTESRQPEHTFTDMDFVARFAPLWQRGTIGRAAAVRHGDEETR